MLQFIAKENSRYSIPEVVQMAVEGGCRWVQVSLRGVDEADWRDTLAEVIPLCREAGAILTVENHAELARELGIHGIQVVGDPDSAARIREFCGPEAIIGVNVRQASDLLALKGVDVDFAVFTGMTPAQLSENVEAARGANIMMALVAAGDYAIQDIPAVMSTGVNGIALGRTIYDAHDPVEATTTVLSILRDFGD